MAGIFGGSAGSRCDGTGLRRDICEHRLEDIEIGYLGSTESGELEPDNEDCLEDEIPGNVVEDKTECKAFDEVEEAKDNPICKPLNIVMGRRGFDGLER